MKSERIERIRSLLYKEVSSYIRQEYQDSFIQITRVFLSKDLKKAKFMFVLLDLQRINRKDFSFIEEKLNRDSKRIKRDLYKNIGLKFVPDFVFEYDIEYELSGGDKI